MNMKSLLTLLCLGAAVCAFAGNTNELLSEKSTHFAFGTPSTETVFVPAPADTNQTDANGKRTGFWSEKMGGYDWKGFYVDGKKHGTFVAYPIGLSMFAMVETYDMGKKNGIFLVADRAGYVVKEEWFRNDSLDGYKRTFYTGGRVKTEEHYKNGKLDGVKRVYNASNKLSEEGYFVNGERSGLNKWFYTDGKINTESNYVNGSLEGTMTSYHPNGNVASKTVYKNNEIEGQYTEFHENGKIKVQGNYVHGKEEGKWVEYYDGGAIYLQGQYSRIISGSLKKEAGNLHKDSKPDPSRTHLAPKRTTVWMYPADPKNTLQETDKI